MSVVERFQQLEAHASSLIIGQSHLINRMLIALLCDGLVELLFRDVLLLDENLPEALIRLDMTRRTGHASGMVSFPLFALEKGVLTEVQRLSNNTLTRLA